MYQLWLYFTIALNGEKEIVALIGPLQTKIAILLHFYSCMEH